MCVCTRALHVCMYVCVYVCQIHIVFYVSGTQRCGEWQSCMCVQHVHMKIGLLDMVVPTHSYNAQEFLSLRPAWAI